MIFGRYVLNGDGFVDNMGAEVVKANGQMLGAGTGFVVGSHLDAAHVVFKGFAMDGRKVWMNRKFVLFKFLKKVNKVVMRGREIDSKGCYGP